MSYRDIRPEELDGWIAKHTSANEEVVILDMRDQTTMRAGHLENALPANDVEVELLLKNRDQPVLIYCYHGHSSRELATFLVRIGMRKVYNLEGGWHALSLWLEQKAKVLPSPGLRQWLSNHGFRGNSIHARIDRGMTTLMLAALDGRYDLMSELLESGVDIHAVNEDGNQALWIACANGSADIIQKLLDSGADIDHLNRNGYNCLMYAASSGKLSVVEQLLQAGADASVESPEGLNALESAATLPVLKRLRAAISPH